MEKGGGGDEGWVRGSFPCSHSAGVSHLTRTFERAAAKKRLRLSLTAEPAQPGSLRTTSRSPSPCRRGGNPEIVPSPGAVPGAQAEPAARRGAARPSPLPRGAALRAPALRGRGPSAPPQVPAPAPAPGQRRRGRGERQLRELRVGAACYRRCRGGEAQLAIAAVEAELLPKPWRGWRRGETKSVPPARSRSVCPCPPANEGLALL